MKHIFPTIRFVVLPCHSFLTAVCTLHSALGGILNSQHHTDADDDSESDNDAASSGSAESIDVEGDHERPGDASEW